MNQEDCSPPVLERMVTLQCSNFYRHLTFLPSRLEDGKIRDDGDTLLVNSGLPSDMFNKATHIMLPPDGTPLFSMPEERFFDAPGDPDDVFLLEQHLTEVEVFFQGLPFTWWLGPDTRPRDLGLTLKMRGYALLKTQTGMHMKLSNIPDAQSDQENSRLEIRWVKEREQLDDYALLIASHGHVPDVCVLNAFRKTADALLMPGGFIHFAVGYMENRPVCGVEYWQGPGRLVGLYGLVALENRRRQEYATALVRAGLQHWKREGMADATVHASPDNLDMFQTMGFRPYGTWTEYGKPQEQNGARLSTG